MESKDYLYVADIVYGTSADGPGFRNSLYVSGCHLRCKGCHNSKWWPLRSGQKRSLSDVYQDLKLDGYDVSILGGEPLVQIDAVYELCRQIKRYRKEVSIWLYTGYEKEFIEIFYPHLMKVIDVLVDGPFVKELADPDLRFRGSSNQHIWKIVNNDNICSFELIE